MCTGGVKKKVLLIKLRDYKDSICKNKIIQSTPSIYKGYCLKVLRSSAHIYIVPKVLTECDKIKFVVSNGKGKKKT